MSTTVAVFAATRPSPGRVCSTLAGVPRRLSFGTSTRGRGLELIDDAAPFQATRSA
jgi:hypothetical protein